MTMLWSQMPYSPMQITGLILATVYVDRLEDPLSCRDHIAKLVKVLTDPTIPTTSVRSIVFKDTMYALAEGCDGCRKCPMWQADWVTAHLPEGEQTATTVVRLGPKAV